MSTAFDAITGSDATEDALAVVDEVQTIASARQYSATTDFSQDEITFPKLRLAQGLTPEVQSATARPGEWLLSGESPVDKARVVPLAFARIRQLRDDNRTMLCQSPDSVHGIGEYGPDSPDNPSGRCTGCPMSEWTPNPRDPKKNLPPKCNQIFSYVCYSLTHKQVVVVEFSRSAMTAAKLINTLAQTRGFGRFAVDLASQSNKGAKGNFFVPSPLYAKVSPEELEEAQAFSPVPATA